MTKQSKKSPNNLSRFFFEHVSNLINVGSKKELTEDDLDGYFNVEDMNLEESHKSFSKHLKEEKNSWPIFRTMYYVFAREYFLCGILRLINETASVVSPFIMQYLLYTAEHHTLISYSTYLIWTLLICIIYYTSNLIQISFWQNFSLQINNFGKKHYVLIMNQDKKCLQEN